MRISWILSNCQLRHSRGASFHSAPSAVPTRVNFRPLVNFKLALINLVKSTALHIRPRTLSLHLEVICLWPSPRSSGAQEAHQWDFVRELWCHKLWDIFKSNISVSGAADQPVRLCNVQFECLSCPWNLEIYPYFRSVRAGSSLLNYYYYCGIGG